MDIKLDQLNHGKYLSSKKGAVHIIDTIFEDSLISDYIEWKEKNKNNFNWWSYVNIYADLDLALAFSKFYYPDVIVVDDCIILRDRFFSDNFDRWKKTCSSKTEIEKMMNLYELDDFFHINTEMDSRYSEKISTLGKVLKLFWTNSFKERFPEKNIIVSLFDDYDGKHFITVYENILNQN